MPENAANSFSAEDSRRMARALELARRGEGYVEPNPMVGCVLARDGEVIAEGWHRRFGGAHAEIEALLAAGGAAAGCTMYVTLEPCCHHGKTPPCTEAIIAAGVRKVVVAQSDPFPQVDGGGLARLREAGIEVHVGLLAPEARKLNAPYLKLVRTGRPWIIAKWALTLDGKIATRTGDSRWISSDASRAVVHELRGRMDAVVVGAQTARRDDPLLTARPPGPRTAARIVIDSSASLSPESQLVRTLGSGAVLVAASSAAPEANVSALRNAGCEVLTFDGDSHAVRLEQLLDELGRRRMTNVLVEGGARLLGSFWDAGLIDEFHVFLAPKIIGGESAPSPLAGFGRELMSQAAALEDVVNERLGSDVYIRGRVAQSNATTQWKS
jgi:diaminohydroxyphosphoribosylaminopyrimidine deaminase/5-amino-6-(5-phosphoribosylamino)uracil reductase